jgi:hypothetical protein
MTLSFRILLEDEGDEIELERLIAVKNLYMVFTFSSCLSQSRVIFNSAPLVSLPYVSSSAQANGNQL